MKSRRHRSPRASTTKCVRVVGQGMPIRLSTADAHRLVVIDGDGEYCPRWYWNRHQQHVADRAPESANWPYSAPRYMIDEKGMLRPCSD